MTILTILAKKTKKLKIGLRKYSKWPDQLQLNPTKFLYFLQRKKLFKISDTETFIFFALNQFNILIYSKIDFLQKHTVKNH